MKATTVILVILVFVIGIGVGWGVAKAATPGVGTMLVAGSGDTSSANAVNAAFNTKSTNLRLTLQALLREHAVLGAIMLTALYTGTDTTRLMQLSDANQNELASFIQTAYGTNTKNTFVTLWSQHMQEYQRYTLAKKNNDTTTMNKAKQNLQTIAHNLGNLLATPNLSSATISGLMMEHVTMTLTLVDDVSAKDVTKAANDMKAGYDQAGQFADTLAKGIIVDKPQLFQ